MFKWVFKNSKRLNCAALIAASLIVTNAWGNGAAIMLLSEQYENESSEMSIPPMGNDGFISVSDFYRDGPHFRVCLKQKDMRVVAYKNYCANKIRILPKWYSFSGVKYKYEKIGEGISLQDYLDNEFGIGVTELVGVGSRSRRYSSNLILFYKITDKI